MLVLASVHSSLQLMKVVCGWLDRIRSKVLVCGPAGSGLVCSRGGGAVSVGTVGGVAGAGPHGGAASEMGELGSDAPAGVSTATTSMSLPLVRRLSERCPVSGLVARSPLECGLIDANCFRCRIVFASPSDRRMLNLSGGLATCDGAPHPEPEAKGSAPARLARARVAMGATPACDPSDPGGVISSAPPGCQRSG